MFYSYRFARIPMCATVTTTIGHPYRNRLNGRSLRHMCTWKNLQDASVSWMSTSHNSTTYQALILVCHVNTTKIGGKSQKNTRRQEPCTAAGAMSAPGSRS